MLFGFDLFRALGLFVLVPVAIVAGVGVLMLGRIIFMIFAGDRERWPPKY